jgi:GNAT superfamily N-acetyltransferase
VSVSTRPATPADLELIVSLIRELAIYERLEQAMKATPADIGALLFDAAPAAYCDIAQIDGEPVGFAFWFYNVSTFEGRRGIYLEDVYVREAHRGAGAGLALLQGLARRCVEQNLARLEWSVLNWNAPSIAFYDQLGADAMDEWTVRRLSGDVLAKLGG